MQLRVLEEENLLELKSSRSMTGNLSDVFQQDPYNNGDEKSFIKEIVGGRIFVGVVKLAWFAWIYFIRNFTMFLNVSYSLCSLKIILYELPQMLLSIFKCL